MLRIGILGASSVAPMALITPAKQCPTIQIAAIASRSEKKAQSFAKKYKIPKYYGSYEALLQDPEIDMVYISLPNNLHCEWTLRAIEAGKHVFCEKPVASNKEEALQIKECADKHQKFVAEGFHYKYHPMIERLKMIVDSGELGSIETISSDLCLYLYTASNHRFSYPLAGGCMMDAGCYPLNLLRYLMGSEPCITSAEAHLITPQVDDQMIATMQFGAVTGKISCSLRTAPWKWKMQMKITGSKGTLYALNPFAPHFINCIRVKTAHGQRIEWMDRKKSSYAHQLTAIAQAIEQKTPILGSIDDAIGNMEAIDTIYKMAGLKVRAEKEIPAICV